MKKWADKYGITIKVTQINDYVESINQYTAGKFDGVTVTNMDALTIPAAGGVDTSAIIIGDFSNGNDGIVLKKAKTHRRHQGPARQPGRAVGVALPARPRAHVGEAQGARHQGREHVGCRHRRRVQVAGFDRGRDLESAADGGEGRAGRDAGLQLEQDPGRDHRHAGGEHRHAQGQSEPRQGARRHLVRDHRADGRPGREGQGGARGDGQALRHRSRRASRRSSRPPRCSTPRRRPSRSPPAPT